MVILPQLVGWGGGLSSTWHGKSVSIVLSYEFMCSI